MSKTAAAMVTFVLGSLYFMAKAKSTVGPCSWAEMQGSLWLPALLTALPLFVVGMGYLVFAERRERARTIPGERVVRRRGELVGMTLALTAIMGGGVVLVAALMMIITCGVRG